MKAIYQDRIQLGHEKIKYYVSAIQKMAFARLGVILGGGALLFYFSQQENVWIFMLSFLGLLLLFMYLVFSQSKLDKLKTKWIKFKLINQNELDILEGKANKYDAGEKWQSSSHPFASDLDVFGNKSLFHLLNRSASFLGKGYLAEKLSQSTPDQPEIIKSTQLEIAQLAADLEWCQNYQIALYDHIEEDTDPLPLLEYYIKKAPSFLPISFFTYWTRFMPFLIVAGIGLGFFYTQFLGIALILGLTQVFISLFYGGKISLWTQHAENIEKITEVYAEALVLIENKENSSRGSLSFKMLHTIIQKLNARNNPLVGLFLNFFLLWDIKYILAFEKWRKEHYTQVHEGIQITSRYEFLISLSTLYRNNPEWTFPIIVEEDLNKPFKPIIKAENLGHPLLDNAVSVSNSYVNTDHHLALITGSNMAGKSTFLRTIGANLILAYLGSAICGKYLEVSRFRVITFMRIKDSLAESTSTFKAELDRIAWVLKVAESHPNTYVLIDEMLRGTNSVDKYRGSKAIIEKLLQLNTFGLIATHDLQLSELEEQFPEKLSNYHFDILMENNQMKFDYKLKEGPCTQFNAAILLKNIGIDITSQN